ncbi:hypothetical protein CB0940_08218 [Cercospora beticola]|uniref:Apple domain-containing protein n=1 Tax=Cercospora beticola TaxID=122368 RepID=A0A2G5HP23_CERBT|nr:hypothetical protein CB0940_08218 [Cercospora beticola]PIA94268.1 hypothetical protein CB0940_08218 [Cercospora beticola]WPB04786.1 hypothetical protein RHO25_009433 [Cercospora beticola]
MQLINSLLAASALASLVSGQDVCGTTGLAIKIPYFRSKAKSLNTAAACGTQCAGDKKCKSYAVGGGYCLIYSSPVRQAFMKTSKGTLKYYDRVCAPVKLTPPASTTTTPAGGNGGSSGGTPVPVDIGGTITEPVIQIADSTPLPSSEVVFPVDKKSFIDAYTYQDDPLPSIVAMGSAPPADGLLISATSLPEAPCMMDPTSNEQFNIVDSGFVPLVSRTRVGIVPLPTPTSEAQAKAMGPADDLPLQAFSFSKPANAPNGVYDIVLAGSTPQYLAKTSQGTLVLTPSSTGPTEQRRNNQNIITSIFGLDCKGRITVKQGSTSYIWEIINGNVRFTPGTSERKMSTYPLKRAAAAKKARKVRRNKYTEGVFPRCPNSPPALVARGFDWVPDFSFGSCCDGHDICFDNCEEGTFEQCNRDFGDCMRSQGCAHLDHWYSYLPYLACRTAADFYEWSVSLPPGKKAFKEANEDRCGNVCASGYCYEGQCYDPPADKCSAPSPMPNGDFSQPNAAWDFCQNTFASIGFANNEGICTGSVSNGQLSMTLSNVLTVEIKSLVKVCPDNQAYEFYFTLKKTVAANANSGVECAFGYKFAGQNERLPDASIKTSSTEDKRYGPFDVGPFVAGQNGVTQNGIALEIPFTGKLLCASIGTATVAFDDFELVPRQ